MYLYICYVIIQFLDLLRHCFLSASTFCYFNISREHRHEATIASGPGGAGANEGAQAGHNGGCSLDNCKGCFHCNEAGLEGGVVGHRLLDSIFEHQVEHELNHGFVAFLGDRVEEEPSTNGHVRGEGGVEFKVLFLYIGLDLDYIFSYFLILFPN